MVTFEPALKVGEIWLERASEESEFQQEPKIQTGGKAWTVWGIHSYLGIESNNGGTEERVSSPRLND